MVKKLFLVVVCCLFVLGISRLSFAMHCHGSSDEHKSRQQVAQATTESYTATTDATTQATQKAEEVGNKVCPVSGEKIEEKTKATYEYKGKIYNFCCPVCIDEFKKDPEKYIKKIEEEKQKEAAETASEKSETETVEHHHEHK